ncbi:hypothetical protein [Mangrovibacterium sp.]|uniref:hypothetical protein n=1 Tax=Mangrovibacterium sp. TaxID=1961364 RepID=UPI003562D11D
MQKRLTLLFFCMLIVSSLFAQDDLDAQLLKQTPNCESVAFNSTKLINRYFDQSNIDSISLVVNKWDEFCGETEPLFRVKVLTNITLATFSEDQISERETEMNLIINYLDRKDLAAEKNYHQLYEYYKFYLGYVPLNSDFDLTTVAWATSLLEDNTDLSPSEKAYCLLYSNQTDEFWNYLQSSDMQGSKLADRYNSEKERVENLWDGHLNFFSGVFVPSSSLNDVIGVKPIFGFQLGAKVKKTQLDLTMSFRPGNAKEYYDVYFQGQTFPTRDHLGGYIGLDFARELTNNFKRELDLEWGIGADFMDVISGDPDVTDDSKTLVSFNFNCGLGYRFYLKNMNYIGLHGKYNLINFNNKRGTDLSGNYLSFTLSYNWFGNPTKYKLLEKMKLK